MMVLAGLFGYVGMGSVMCAFATFYFLVIFPWLLFFLFFFDFLLWVGGKDRAGGG